MSKTMLKRLTLFALALLTVGGANAATETYDFEAAAKALEDASEKFPTYDGVRIFNVQNPSWINIEKMTLTQIETNGRFAAEARTANGFNLRKAGGDWNGLNSGYAAVRYFSILNLEAGDKVTITYNQGTLNNYTRNDGSATITDLGDAESITSGTEYTIAAAGRFDIKTGTDKVNIQKIVIETSVATETIHIGKTTEDYNFESVAKGSTVSTIDPLTIGETIYSRFSTQQDNCFQVSGSGWGWQVNYNKWFSINNLKKGDKIWVKYDTSNSQVVNFDDASQIGKTGTVQLESETWYTLAKDADKLKLVNATNENGKKANYKEIKIETTNTAITAGTLVSSAPLDFTGSAVKAYYASSACDETVTLTPINKVAAGTPIYIKATDAGIYEVPQLNSDADDTTGNLLKGSASSSTVLTSNADTKYYVFGVKGSQVGFYLVTGDANKKFTSAAGKAYLEVKNTPSNAPAYLAMYFNDMEPTGIEAVEQPAVRIVEGDGYWYNLQGQRVDNPTKGIYVRNGKKVFLK